MPLWMPSISINAYHCQQCETVEVHVLLVLTFGHGFSVSTVSCSSGSGMLSEIYFAYPKRTKKAVRIGNLNTSDSHHRHIFSWEFERLQFIRIDCSINCWINVHSNVCVCVCVVCVYVCVCVCVCGVCGTYSELWNNLPN